MIEVTGDLWTYPADYRVITTNGAVRSDGCCVMGRGCALQAKNRYPKLAYELGQRIKAEGNKLHYFPEYKLWTFPVKHSWDQRADLKLIEQSVEEFYIAVRLGNILQHKAVPIVMPRPGCGNGQLRWCRVKPLLEKLPDNVFVIDFGK